MHSRNIKNKIHSQNVFYIFTYPLKKYPKIAFTICLAISYSIFFIYDIKSKVEFAYENVYSVGGYDKRILQLEALFEKVKELERRNIELHQTVDYLLIILSEKNQHIAIDKLIELSKTKHLTRKSLKRILHNLSQANVNDQKKFLLAEKFTQRETKNILRD